MSVSEILLSLVAFRLAVLVLLVAAVPALSVQSHRDDPVLYAPLAATPVTACGPAIDDGQENVLINEMQTHD